MAEVEIGLGKSGRRGYGFDDVAIVPSRRTRDPEMVDLSWEIDAFRFSLPLMAAPTDSVVSPASAVELDRLGGLGVLHLEGLWARHEDPEPFFEELTQLLPEKALLRMQELYAEPIKPELVKQRVHDLREAGVVAAGAVSPKRLAALAPTIVDADLDLLVVEGGVISAEHVSKAADDPLNLKTFVRQIDLPVIVGGCASYQAALHLMRTGAAGVLVGVGSGHSGTTRGVLGVGVPRATAIADVRAARMRHLDETGVYCHVIAYGGMATSGDIAKAIVCGADGVMIGAPLAASAEAPGRGWHWSMASVHPTLPQGTRVHVGTCGSLEEILVGPARDTDGSMNLFGGVRTSMATCGYETLKEFQKAELMVVGGEAGGGRSAASRETGTGE